MLDYNAVIETFKSRVSEMFVEAQAYKMLLGWGNIAIKDHLIKYPSSRAFTGVGHPDDSNCVLPSFRVDKAIETYSRHENIIEELFLCQFVQEWFLLLDVLFEFHVISFLTGSSTTKLVSSSIRFPLSSIDPISFVGSISLAARRSFSFEPAKYKTEVVERSLGVKFGAAEKRKLSKAIMLRNVLQHNNGVLREEDLKEVGEYPRGVSLLDGKKKKFIFREGDRVLITVWELDDVCRCFLRVAALLMLKVQNRLIDGAPCLK